VNWQEITLPSFEKSKRNQGNTITETFDQNIPTPKDNEKRKERKNGGKG
jgi:hypothetical protein